MSSDSFWHANCCLLSYGHAAKDFGTTKDINRVGTENRLEAGLASEEV